jgi:hypothetical protein
MRDEDPEQIIRRGDELCAGGRFDDAAAAYRRALLFDSKCRLARRSLARLLVRIGKADESFPLWREEILVDEGGASSLLGAITDEMRRNNLQLAADYAAIYAELRWGSASYPQRVGATHLELPVRPFPSTLTRGKLRHDLEQFAYLQDRDVLDGGFADIVEGYRRALDRLSDANSPERAPLDDEDTRCIGQVFNRIIHIRRSPRVPRALSQSWDRAAVQAQYLDTPPGIVVVDDFLDPEALKELRLFCLESTIWSANRYAHGRLGAFFEAGFNCPLLLQIAEETRAAFPRVIGDRYPLEQMWGFKYSETLPKNVSTHADFAAVNVNFWITPDRANLHPDSGGMVIYDVDAPADWDFKTYQNTDWSVLAPFLERLGARPIYVPYRQNRAVIFNSDLFHGTAELHFRSGYENRRLNITLLFGNRAADVHHPRLAHTGNAGGGSVTAWRSQALKRRARRMG